MELPPFDLLWQSSKKIQELESVLEEIDQNEMQKKFSSRKRGRHRDGLFGVGFAIEDRSYYEPYQYCCDHAFYTEAAFNTHVSQHVKCEVEGCSFVSHPKSMRLHKEVVHDSGLFDKIYRDTTDDAIIQWREARKRNYPTLERAAVKQEILSERLARGQVFETQEFGAFNRRRAPVITPRDVLQCSKAPNTSNSTNNPDVVQVTEESWSPTKQSPPHENGIATLPHESDQPVRLVPLDYDSDGDNSPSERSSPDTVDDTDSDSVAPGPVTPELVSHRSPSAIPPLNDASPEDNHETHSNDDQTFESVESQQQSQRGRRRRRGGRRRRQRLAKRCTHSNSDAEEHELDDKPVGSDTIGRPQQKSESSSTPPPSTSSSNPFASHPVVQLRAQRRACLTDPNRIHSRPTLLQMLLAEDMRTERNHLMQCVRYVVKNNFFLDDRPP